MVRKKQVFLTLAIARTSAQKGEIYQYCYQNKLSSKQTKLLVF